MKRMAAIITGVVFLALVLVPGVWAQAPTPEETVQAYYVALGEAVASGDVSELLDLFADDATLTIPAISETPVQGKETMQSLFAGMSMMIQGMTITVDEMATEGDQVTVTYRMTSETMGNEMSATDTFTVKDGKITSLTIQMSDEALTPVTLPATLPTTGAVGVNFLPGVLLIVGASLIGLGRKVRS